MFTLLMELYAVVQVTILLSVMNQMGRNVAFIFSIQCFGGTPGSHSWNPELPRNLS